MKDGHDPFHSFPEPAMFFFTDSHIPYMYSASVVYDFYVKLVASHFALFINIHVPIQA